MGKFKEDNANLLKLYNKMAEAIAEAQGHIDALIAINNDPPEKDASDSEKNNYKNNVSLMWGKYNKAMESMKTAMLNFNLAIEEQGKKFDNIEKNINEAMKNTDKGLKLLEQAKKF